MLAINLSCAVPNEGLGTLVSYRSCPSNMELENRNRINRFTPAGIKYDAQRDHSDRDLSSICKFGLLIVTARAWAFPVHFGLAFIYALYFIMLTVTFLMLMERERSACDPSFVCGLSDVKTMVLK